MINVTQKLRKEFQTDFIFDKIKNHKFIYKEPEIEMWTKHMYKNGININLILLLAEGLQDLPGSKPRMKYCFLCLRLPKEENDNTKTMLHTYF